MQDIGVEVPRRRTGGGRRQRTLGSSDGTAVHGFGESWGCRGGLGWARGTAAAKKGGAASACGSPVQRMSRILRVCCCSPKSELGVASRGIQAWEEAGVRLGSDAARGRGPRCRRAARADRASEAKTVRGGRGRPRPVGSSGQREQRGGGGAVLAWAGASGRPRREGESGEGRAHVGRAGLSVEGELDCGERRSRPKGKKGGRPGWAGLESRFALPFPSLFFSNPFETLNLFEFK
jgi:hypothetical protein